VVVSERAMDAMLDAADRHGLDVVSPSLAEGPLDYDFEAHSAAFIGAMKARVNSIQPRARFGRRSCWHRPSRIRARIRAAHNCGDSDRRKQ